jgi:hypothetical protein
MDQGSKVRGDIGVGYFVGKETKFEFDATFDGKPV